MAFAVVVVVGVLAGLALILFVVGRLQPENFRLKATVTKWLSLDLEVQGGRNPGTRHHDSAGDDENARELEPRSDGES
jgi:hypothetical protein